MESGKTIYVYSVGCIQIDIYKEYSSIYILGTNIDADDRHWQIKDKYGEIERELREIESYLNNMKINKKMFFRMAINRENEKKVD